jgi:molybdenum cofactor cytidylyltransferase
VICDAIVLAAGPSTRLGRPKQLLRLGDATLLERAVAAVNEASVRRIVVVLGADAVAVRAQVPARFDCILNSNWSEGMASSIRAGLDALDSPDAVLLAVCDQPRIPPRHFATLVQTAASNPDQPVASGYSGTVGVPAVFPRRLFTALANLTGGAGARSVLRESSQVIVIPCAEAACDVDTPDDAAALEEPGDQQT